MRRYMAPVKDTCVQFSVLKASSVLKCPPLCTCNKVFRIICLLSLSFFLLQQLVYFSSHSHECAKWWLFLYLLLLLLRTYYMYSPTTTTTTTTIDHLVAFVFLCFFILLRRYRPRLVSSAHRPACLHRFCSFRSRYHYRHHRER